MAKRKKLEKDLELAEAEIVRLQECIIMAVNRLNAAFMDEPVCIQCVKLALTYLRVEEKRANR